MLDIKIIDHTQLTKFKLFKPEKITIELKRNLKRWVSFETNFKQISDTRNKKNYRVIDEDSQK